ncbi:MAG: GNAT family N-acetyltransferase [Burkholderiales bacterium]|nr:GNAT family N-acetyltransferase [Burkholderiales bacterium]
MIENFLNKKPENQIKENNEELELHIEIAKEGDWEDYRRIRLEAIEKEPNAYHATEESKKLESNYSEEKWKKDLTGDDTFVALSKNKDVPVGMAHALVRSETKDDWAVRSVYLNKKFRGRGHGEEIMNFLLNEIKRRGGKRVTLNVINTQKEAKMLYEKLGFESIEEFPAEEENGIIFPGGFWMKKEI